MAYNNLLDTNNRLNNEITTLKSQLDNLYLSKDQIFKSSMLEFNILQKKLVNKSKIIENLTSN